MRDQRRLLRPSRRLVFPYPLLDRVGREVVTDHYPGRTSGGPFHVEHYRDRMHLRRDLSIPLDGWPSR